MNDAKKRGGKSGRRILVDTNILIDTAVPGRAGHEAALLLMDEVAYNEVEALVTATSLKDMYYILTKCGDEKDARDQVRNALVLFTVEPLDLDICREAAESDEPDFEDGIIRACAERAGVDYIISRDEGAFSRSTVKRLTAQEYVEMFCPLEEVEL